MEVILKEDVDKLGSRGDVVKVAEGYGRNFLLPRKLAIEATAANRAVIEQMKASAVRRLAREKGDAEALAKQFAGVELTFTRKTGEHDQLFGSVTSSDIARELEGKGFNVDRRKIQLTDPLKTVGNHQVSLKLHKEVSVPIKVKILKEGGSEEAAALAAPAATEEASAEA
jgi:large subunit ribosomal protein L9